MPVKRRALVIGLLAIGAVAAGSVWRARPLEVRTVGVRRGEAIEMVYATGFVEPEQPVSLAARLTAPVVAVEAGEGDFVRKGQPLIVLDSSEQQGLLIQAQAERRGAELSEARVGTLYREGWMTRAALDQAAATAAAARAGEQAASARVSNNVIRAPFDGIVLKRDVEAGDLATAGRILMQVGSPHRLRITATVDERDIVNVRPGQEVWLSSESLPGRILRGRVQSITPGGDPTQRAFRVRLVLSQSTILPFGLTLEANIVTRRRDATLLLSNGAIQGDHVFVIDSRGRASRRQVRTGILGRDAAEVVSGLTVGEEVIVQPPAGLSDGDRVRRAK